MLGTDPDLHEVNLIQTTAALEADVTTLALDTALQIIGMWYDAVLGEDEVDLGDVAAGLAELRDLLRADALDGPAIGETLVRLGQATYAAAQQAPDERLAPRLEQLATQLSMGGNILSGGSARSTADEADQGR